VFAGFFVVVFVVVDTGGAEVDFGVEEFGDEGAEGIGFGEGGELVAEFEVSMISWTFWEKPLR
jgi:hypothetical protein